MTLVCRSSDITCDILLRCYYFCTPYCSTKLHKTVLGWATGPTLWTSTYGLESTHCKTVHWDFLLGTSNRSHSACMYHVTYRPVTPLCWIRFSVCISARAFTTSLSLAREWFRKSAGEFVGVFDCSKLRVSIATVVKKSPRLVCQGSIKVAVIRCWTQRKIESNRLHRITSQISCLPPVSSRREPERRLGPLKTRFTASTYVFAWRNTSTKVQRTALGSSATGLRLFQACGRSKRRTNYLK